MNPVTKITTYNNINISYTTEGEGDTLVLLHGYMMSKEVFRSISSLLSETLRVIAIDLPGHGQTGVFAPVHTMELMADVVRIVLEECDVDKCVMVGHSMGGYVALDFAERYEVLLKGLGLMNSSALKDTAEAKRNRLRMVDIVRANRHGFINEFLPNLFAPRNIAKYKDSIDEIIEIANMMNAENIASAQLGMVERTGKTRLLRSLDIPFMLISGKLDPRQPIDKVLSQIELPKHAELLLLDGVGHVSFIEAESVVAEVLRSFTHRCFL